MLKVPTRLWPKGQKWAEYNEIVEPGFPLSVVMSRDYWIHVHQTLRPFDVITVVAADGSFDADIRLVLKTSTEMKFRLIRGGETEQRAPISRDETRERFTVTHRGRGSYGVQEKTTGHFVAEGLDRESADAEKARLEMAA